MRLSVVVITLNEERDLGRCLASVKDVADEIVVVDSHSTDGTERVALEHGARFIRHAFEGHIEQKNWAVAQARYDRVLSLDADEALDDTLVRSITEVKQNDRADGYEMDRLTNYCGTWIRHGGWYPDTKLRLFDRRKGQWGGVNPHDKFEMSPDARVAHIKGDILHYSYRSLDGHIRQVNYFTDISARAYHARGKRAGLHELLLNPVAKFVGDYFLRAGFLDGYHGFIIAVISSHATFLKYAKLRELWRNDRR